MRGILVLDKPSGLTSHDVVDRVRRLLGERRVGHAGTLDPPATGVLVLGVGQATRVLRFLPLHEKEYRASVRLGWETATGDACGEPLGAPQPVQVSGEEIEAALAAFRGEISQVPPAVSALKVGGAPAYLRVRRGEAVEPEPRRVAIYQLELTTYRPPLVELRLVTSPGTYVRSVARDLGRMLGCGAHLATLRRTRVGAYGLAEAQVLPDPSRAEDLAQAVVPLERALAHLEEVRLGESDSAALLCGVAPRLTDAPPPGDAGGGERRVCLRDPAGRVLAVARRPAEGDRFVLDCIVGSPGEL